MIRKEKFHKINCGTFLIWDNFGDLTGAYLEQIWDKLLKLCEALEL